MRIRRYQNYLEEIYSETLDNGLKVYIVPKKDYQKYFCCFGTKYGSGTNCFIPSGEEEYLRVPLGIAHFLEHKKFELPNDVNASDIFANLGIDTNAYTTFVETVYLATGTKECDFAVKYLLDFVQTPHFDEKSIKKEQGIITQEINMYLDSPRERLYSGLLENMFMENEIRYDIAGTKSSIKKINRDLLLKCYNSFYHPSNMVFCIVGNVDPEKVIALIKENQEQKNYTKNIEIKRKFYVEDGRVYKKSSSSKMDIIIPKVAVGVKIPYFKPDHNQLMLMELLLKIIMESTIGGSTSFYQYLLDEQLISGGYSYVVSVSETACFIKIQADTSKPKQFIKILRKQLLTISKLTIDEETFERYKKVIIGSFIRGLNSVEEIATAIMEYEFRDSEIFETLELFKSTTNSQIEKLKGFFNEDAICDYTIYPLNK